MATPSTDRRGGLPQRRRMRHDAHYVERLTTRHEEPIGRLIAVVDLEANPFQPRAQMGDLSGLIASVKEKGVLEPLIVRCTDQGRFQLISGERRLRAAQAAGLKAVPCVEIDADDGEALEVALVENIQRRDLNAFEEGDGFLALKERFGHTHQTLAEKLGRSRSAVTEALSISKIPEPVRELCHSRDVLSRSALLQVARAGTRERMESTVLRIAAGGAQREDLVKERKEAEGKAKPGRPKHFKFRWQPEEKSFAVQINFKKQRVSKAEVVTAVRNLLEELEAAEE